MLGEFVKDRFGLFTANAWLFSAPGTVRGWFWWHVATVVNGKSKS